MTHTGRRFSRRDLVDAAHRQRPRRRAGDGRLSFLVPPAAVKTLIERGDDVERPRSQRRRLRRRHLPRSAAAERRLLRHVDLPAGTVGRRHRPAPMTVTTESPIAADGPTTPSSLAARRPRLTTVLWLAGSLAIVHARLRHRRRSQPGFFLVDDIESSEFPMMSHLGHELEERRLAVDHRAELDRRARRR